MSNLVAAASIIGAVVTGITAVVAAPVTVPLAIATACIVSIGGFFSWLFSKGPTKQNDTMLKIEERLELEEEVAVAKQQNEEEKRRLIEKEKEIEERERRLQDENTRVNRAPEQERAGREDGVQPIQWPTREEFRQALKNVQYSSENFHFAIAGKAGSGKSSMINAFIDLGSRDQGVAPTGTKETTLEISRYPDPGSQPPRSQTVWFDVPGAGTTRFSSWQYFNKLGLFVFDFIIVAIGDRFEETDCEILRKCRQFEIPSFIVRSKADQHILNLMQDEDPDIESLKDDEECYLRCREVFINDTEEMVSEGLKMVGLPDQRVYIVSRSTLRKAYRSSLGQLTVLKGVIHEVKLVENLMQAAIQRRSSTEEIEEAREAYTRSTHNQNHGNSTQVSNTAHAQSSGATDI